MSAQSANLARLSFRASFGALVLLAQICSTLEAIEPDSFQEAPITQSDREHWSFKPVNRPVVPHVVASGWAQTPIDAFVLAAIEEAGTTPSPEADRATLIRRLSFNLIGLPPTIDDVNAFLNDHSPTAYEKQVDRLLASPGYGDRWGQHWLDLARYAQTDGFEHDRVRADAWKYRDWVIESLNSDIPYDRFVALQVAGDLIDEAQQSIATTFCLAGPDMPDVNDQEERRHNMLNELTSTVGSVFLGLQLGCAQCHDHKYDPISQGDFYRLRAVFESAVPTLKRDAPYNSLSQHADAPDARFWNRGDHRQPGPMLEPAFPRIADPQGLSGSLSTALYPRAEFGKWLTGSDNPLTPRIIVNRLWQHHFSRGIFADTSDAGLVSSEPSHPELLDWLAAELRSVGWSLKRLHRMIVCSATYRQASRSRDSDLVWQQRFATDPSNTLFSRFPRRRLEGEAIRDAILSVSGLLSTDRGGAGVMPPLPEELVGTLLKGQWTASSDQADHVRRSVYLFARRNLRYPLFETFDRPDANASCPVRGRSTTALQSLELFNGQFSLLAARNLAGRALDSAVQIDRSRWFENSIETAFLRAYSRRPAEAERQHLFEFFNDHSSKLIANIANESELAQPVSNAQHELSPQEGAALVDICLAIFNTSEFLYID